MPKKAQELTQLAIKKLTKIGRHAVGGVAGLYLLIGDNEAKSWVLRMNVNGVRRDMGLGSFADLSLSAARDKARNIRQQIASGTNPIEERKKKRHAAILQEASAITFEKACAEFLTTHKQKWKNAKHKSQWEATLKTYAYPVIGKIVVSEITLPHIIKILEPIWTTKTETASRLRGRIETVLDWAIVREYRNKDNPARWKGYLDKVLPSPKAIAKPVHHKAIPVAAVAAFFAQLQSNTSMSSKALQFLILTATRSNEVRGATWDEIDFEKKIWTIPAERMKAAKEHRIPLASQAIALLKSVPRHAREKYIFVAPRGGQLSDMALTVFMRRLNVDAVPHGFRSTFRDWVAEHTNYPNHVAEMALAHTISNKVEAAYRRGDLFDKRREMMNEWAGFCTAT
ncbi:MAG: tyrosine-type recombinase/integrase [Bacteroidia bacterium]|jgi:integrase|nr:tyrosine-type recombinase/integrase [Bacteroidia bacterium]